MSVVVSFEEFLPPARYDSTPWATVQIEETDDPIAGTSWVQIDVGTLTPVDSDPGTPAPRSFTTVNGTDFNLWYRLIWDDGSATSDPTVPLQNGPDGLSPGYVGIDELARILKIRTPNAPQRDAMRRAIGAARIEIDSEIDLETPLEPPYPDLVRQVNLDRAQELWQQQEATLGFVGLGAEAGPARVAADTWLKHAIRLAPLKDRFGIA